MSLGVGTPSRERTRWVLCSSRMMSIHSSTHSSQMNTVGPAISLRTSCWLFPQNEQYSVLLVSPLAALVIFALTLRRREAQRQGHPPEGRSYPAMQDTGRRLSKP